MCAVILLSVLVIFSPCDVCWRMIDQWLTSWTSPRVGGHYHLSRAQGLRQQLASQGPGTDVRLRALELRCFCQSRKWEYVHISLISFKPGKTQKRKNPGLSVFMCMCTLLVFMWALEKLSVCWHMASHICCVYLWGTHVSSGTVWIWIWQYQPANWKEMSQGFKGLIQPAFSKVSTISFIWRLSAK